MNIARKEAKVSIGIQAYVQYSLFAKIAFEGMRKPTGSAAHFVEHALLRLRVEAANHAASLGSFAVFLHGSFDRLRGSGEES